MRPGHGDEWDPGHVRLGEADFFARPERGLSAVGRGRSVVLMRGYEPVAVVRPISDEERAYYASQAQRSRRMIAIVTDLPERFADRLPADELERYRRQLGAGEWHEPAGCIVASLVKRRLPVSRDEYDLLAELIELFRPSWGSEPWLRPDRLAALDVTAEERDVAGDPDR